MKSIESRVIQLETRLAGLNRVFRDLRDNQRHYIRHKMGQVNKWRAAERASHRMDKLGEIIGKINVMPTRKSTREGVQRIILLVSHNQAMKLRRLADMDLRPLLCGKNKSL